MENSTKFCKKHNSYNLMENRVFGVFCAPLFVFEFPASVLYEGHCAEVNSQCLFPEHIEFTSQCLSLVFSGHCEFTYAQCPGTQTEERNSNTNKDESHTQFLRNISLCKTIHFKNSLE